MKDLHGGPDVRGQSGKFGIKTLPISQLQGDYSRVWQPLTPFSQVQPTSFSEGM